MYEISQFPPPFLPQTDLMTAEIIAVGTELTSGAKLDTNSQWLSTELAAFGIEVQYHTSVADTQSAMVSVLRAAAERSDLVLITGGLGPTLDDLTRQAMAETAGVELVLDQASLDHIRSMFARRNREMAERNVIQANFPAGATPIPNPIGTAPGIWQELRNSAGGLCQLAAMPGVPAEMKKMFLEQVVPRLPVGNKVIRRTLINCFGVGESDCEQMLGELTARGRNPEVGITVHEATITLRINSAGSSAEECEQLIESARREAHQRLGTLIFSEGDEELEHVVLRRLAERNLTLSTIESGTGGLLAHRLTDVREFRDYYHGGIVIPRGSRHWELLGIPENLIAEHGVAGKETARRMAAACREKFQTDFALAVTDCPEDDDNQTEAPRGYIALALGDDVRVIPHTPIGDATLRKSRAAKAALNLLRLHLLKEAPSGAARSSAQ